ncbi:MAG: hypothetical protein GF383_13335 [Candidatus Lokiarchaeota archaeon]|nr:hypothetical protein [Candidatus Lokiarchaeota archaeon]MBD3342174.1 hypothetical protein [Candidatus Lokiarchaeota archaeon]
MEIKKTRSEDTLIFYALSPGDRTITPICQALESFFSRKKELDPSSRFNIIFFQEMGPNYLENFTLNPEHILIVLKSLESEIVKANVAGGIMVAVSFIIDVFKRISEKCFRLIILMDSKASKVSPIFIPVLENLINQVKDMPFFIDIVHIDVMDSEEFIKLSKLVEICHGEIYQVKKLKNFSNTLEDIAKNRVINPNRMIEGNKFIIPEENRLFYENLAQDLITAEGNHNCSICFIDDDRKLVQCPNCNTIAHNVCWAQWAEKSSIGIPNVFRCYHCFQLIKLSREFVDNITYTKLLGKNVNVEVVEVKDFLEQLEPTNGPNLIQVEDPTAIASSTPEDFDVEEIETTPNKKVSVNGEIKFMLCPHCFKMITNEYLRCPACNRKLK